MQPRYPDFFARHPQFLPHTATSDPLANTLESFTRQRLDLRPPGPEFARQWEEHLRRNLGRAVSCENLKDKLILDVGCGFGRHLYVASQAGAEVVGIDLSAGVDVARQNNRDHPRCHIVQADILERPLREEAFDVVWSFGVLHHMPEPRT
jgi:SAM-dependent methyltransferase